MSKKIIKQTIFSAVLYLITYVVAIWCVCGFISLNILLKPYAYMMLFEVHLVKTVALAVSILYLSVSFVIFYSKKMNADTILVILSYFFPIVGLILGIVYRVKYEKSKDLSNTYLFTAIASIIPLLVISFYFLAFI